MGLDDVRLSLHVLGACVWVGGQLVLAALVPALRAYPGAAAAAGRRFRVVAWPAFALLVVTGAWNLTAQDEDERSTGVTAYAHERAQAPRARAVTGALTGLFALLAVVLGVVLSG